MDEEMREVFRSSSDFLVVAKAATVGFSSAAIAAERTLLSLVKSDATVLMEKAAAMFLSSLVLGVVEFMLG